MSVDTVRTTSPSGKTSPSSVWLPVLRPSPEARVRLFCLPYAGGAAASFGRWPDRLPPTIEVRPVQLPGRWGRLREPPFRRFDEAMRALVEVLVPYMDQPFALFGHSMGALLAFELARHLQRQGLPPPLQLVVSGHRAPQLPDDDLPSPDLNDRELIDWLRDLNGTPREVLDQPELMDLLLPVIRADFELCRSYVYMPGPPLTCPLTVCGGVDDDESAEGRLEAWRQHTTGPSKLLMFPGDHFFLHSAEASLLRALGDSLGALALAPRPRA